MSSGVRKYTFRGSGVRPLFKLIAIAALLWFNAVGATRACTLDELNACVNADPAAAERLLLERLSAFRGAEELRRLGDFYLNARPPFQDFSLAIEYYEESARGGDVWALKGLAEMLLKGEGTPSDPRCAVSLLEEAAKSGLVGPSSNTLGDYYRSTNDFTLALDAYSKASDVGEVWAMKSLADMLFKGEGTEADPRRAVELLEQASAMGLKGPAFYALGTYYRSIGEFPTALEAYRQASGVGEVWAMASQADMLLKGEGAAADPEEALELLRQAATGGLVGQSYLAIGEHHRRVGDFEMALLAFQKASDAGETAATQALAEMLYKGEGTEADPERAAALLEKANLPVPSSDLVPDPPSTYTGTRLKIGDVVSLAFAAGFQTEEQLLTAVAVAISESGLWTSARNWQPHRGYRPSVHKITVPGPEAAWSKTKIRQLHSDRGLWQIASFWWPQYSDAEVDDPTKAASLAFVVSRNGTNFSDWDSYRSGYAQSLFDKSVDGWPALRPVVISFLDSLELVEPSDVNWMACLDRTTRYGRSS
jgi:TPR repeat protein